jgi:hypothetical protein
MGRAVHDGPSECDGSGRHLPPAMHTRGYYGRVSTFVVFDTDDLRTSDAITATDRLLYLDRSGGR